MEVVWDLAGLQAEVGTPDRIPYGGVWVPSGLNWVVGVPGSPNRIRSALLVMTVWEVAVGVTA